jgi:hypothetical protein
VRAPRVIGGDNRQARRYGPRPMSRPSLVLASISVALVALVLPARRSVAEPLTAATTTTARESSSSSSSSSSRALVATSSAALTTAAPVAGPAAPELPPIDMVVTATTLLGVGGVTHHHDANGYPETAEGLLVTEVDAEVGPIVVLDGRRPHYLEAQVASVQRDAVLLARRGARADQRPDGSAFTIPYGYGALKLNTSIVTLVEAQLVPHFSDNQKSYQLFPLTDLYLGGALALTGPRADARFIHTEQYVGYAQVGLNLLALAGARINATHGAFAVPLVVGGGYRYPSLVSFLGTHWTTGLELTLGAGDADELPTTRALIVLPGVVHELEWALDREVARGDHRADARPSDWGQQALFVRVGLYADLASGSGGAGGLLVDVAVGWRFNLLGPTIPEHAFKDTRVTYASERYVARKREEEVRQRALEERFRQREGAGSTP